MTQEEYIAKSAELLEGIPEEFHQSLTWYAYDKGHAYGYSEVISYLDNITDMLRPCIEKYTARIAG